ncbi:hypothetical protein ACGFOU_18875 [Streptomyces sp. NPDC048595]|uniref:hypothetical protein n=1 Tax=Streptomyces sp. NPDC048595 TaxID=3365576 RepID=UPI00371E5EEF
MEGLIGFVALATLLYVILRWAAVSLAAHLARAAGHAVDLVAAGLLLPEYVCTSVMRRSSGRAAPFAHVYGDAVCGAALAAHACVEVAASTVRAVFGHLPHIAVVVVSVLTAATVTWLLGG